MKFLTTKCIYSILFIVALHFNLQGQSYYPIKPIPFTSVEVNDEFWAPKIQTNHDVTIPHGFTQSANRLENFKIAAGVVAGSSFQSEYPFDDSDIYKLIEGSAYSLKYFPDAELEEYIDSVITIICMAQEEDGYLYTIRSIQGDNSHSWIGTRWQYVEDLSHELYNLGHLFEASVAYYESTGKENLLNIAKKAADLIVDDFGWNIGQLQRYPGHQIVETGLARLYRATGDIRYLDLAKFFLDVRGPNGEEYCQAHAKVTDQTEAVGHAVRAVYMYAGMADVAALTRDNSYINAIDHIWDDIVSTKLYVTGGIGASGGNEGFNGAYNLPNSSAYCETCASIGNVYLNQRLFLLHGDAKYIDVLERTLYNALISGVSVSGDRFFYPNRLLSTGSEQRSVWFGCACCPPNVTRLIPSVPGYVYASTSDSLYVNLFMKNHAHIAFDNDSIEISQETDYPWNGNIDITLNPKANQEFALFVRIPGWAQNEPVPTDIYTFSDSKTPEIHLLLNGQEQSYTIEKGYAIIRRTWSPGDVVSLQLDMTPRTLKANDNITEDINRIAIQRGPLVYCAEGVDNGGEVLTQVYSKEQELTSQLDESLFSSIYTIYAQTIETAQNASKQMTLIPYFLWANRGGSEMQVWLSALEPKVIPDSLIIIDEDLGDFASANYVSSWENLNSIYDLYDPISSADKGAGAFGNWNSGASVGVWNWVQYDFHQSYTIGSSDVYWWDDNAGITLPDNCYLEYWDDNTNAFVKIPGTDCAKADNCIAYDMYNTKIFEPVTTDKIRLNFIGNEKAQGILEWSVYTTGNNVSVPYTDAATTFQCFPNPVTDKLYINVSNGKDALVTIYNMIGEVVYENTLQNNIVIEKSQIGGAGLYTVLIITNGTKQYAKIVIR